MLRLNKQQDKRVRAGHPWIFSNEINTSLTPLKSFTPGTEVIVTAHDGFELGAAYVNPHSLIAGRIFSRHPRQVLCTAFFEEQIAAALAHRDRVYDAPFYRLVFSEADGLPGVIVDRFDMHLVVQINTAGMEMKKDMIKEALLAVLPQTQSILLRNDSPIRTQEGLPLYIEPMHGTPPDVVDVIENGVPFKAPLASGQKTGWFYDHRDNRARLKKYVKDRTVLDVFSYLGAFGIQAAKFGASKVDCIDASAAACDFIKSNAELNNVADKVSVINDDAFDALKQLIADRKSYDVVVLDPPAFVKKMKDLKEGAIAYQRLNELGLKLLNPGGILVSCSCSMHIKMEDLTFILQRAAYKAERPAQLIERGHQGLDHPIHLNIPETDYLKAIVIQRIL